MADADLDRHPQQFLHSLRRYVHAPLSAASCIVARERTELTAERDAFEAFRDRLTRIDPAAMTSAQSTAPGLGIREPTVDQMERVRAAYRETVMSVSHYDEIYGESLVEHIAAECGAELAEGLRHETSVSLTAPYKNTLLTAAAQAAHRRQVFIETLDQDAQLIERAHTELTDLIAELDTTTIPKWYRESFTDRLDSIARERQETLQTRRSVPRLDEHSLCTHLYHDEPWTYPVLTAVARVRETVVLS